MSRLRLTLGALILLAPPVGGGEVASGKAPVHGYEIVQALPHDPTAFTQGLLFHDGVFYESTGLNGGSSLRIVEPATGRVLRRVNLPRAYFGEGIALLEGKVFQLTWRNRVGFIYESGTLKSLGVFRYEGEGWGLTTDGRSLILSDGTERLRFYDPRTFALQRTLPVHADDGRPVRRLNELEYVKGEIYANVWERDVIARIDPATGKVRAWIDLSGLHTADAPEAVLNGIAYDPQQDRLYVTGKFWPKLYEIRTRNRSP